MRPFLQDFLSASTIKTLSSGDKEHNTLKAKANCEDLLESVTSVLLDPSCSGSGIMRNIERVSENESDHEINASVEDKPNMKKNTNHTHQDPNLSQRIRNLAFFQRRCLERAMTLPNVHTVVYSTCSIHEVQ